MPHEDPESQVGIADFFKSLIPVIGPYFTGQAVQRGRLAHEHKTKSDTAMVQTIMKAVEEGNVPLLQHPELQKFGSKYFGNQWEGLIAGANFNATQNRGVRDFFMGTEGPELPSRGTMPPETTLGGGQTPMDVGSALVNFSHQPGGAAPSQPMAYPDTSGPLGDLGPLPPMPIGGPAATAPPAATPSLAANLVTPRPATIPRSTVSPELTGPTAGGTPVDQLVAAAKQPGDIRQGTSLTLKMGDKMTGTVSGVTSEQQGQRMIAAAGRLMPNDPEMALKSIFEAFSRVGVPFPQNFERYADVQSSRLFTQEKKRIAEEEGLTGRQLDQAASQSTFEKTGYRNTKLPEPFMDKDDARRQSIGLAYQLKDRPGATAYSVTQEMKRRGLALDNADESSFLKESYGEILTDLTENKGVPRASAIKIAAAAVNNKTDAIPESDRKIAFEPAPMRTEVAERIGELPGGVTPGTATAEQRRAARLGAEERETELRPLRTGLETQARLQVERGIGTGAVPERPTPGQQEKSTERESTLAIVNRVMETANKNPNWFGGPLGTKGRVSSFLSNIDMAPKGFAEFWTDVKKIQSDMQHALAGAAVGPRESLYTEVFPDINKDSTQKFMAKIKKADQNLRMLDAIAAKKARESATRPLPAAGGGAKPPLGFSPERAP